MSECAPTRPILRYHGGKWRLAPWIISHFPEHRVYTEVYGGGASVLLRKARSYAEVYNDLDGAVTNLFRVLRDPGRCEELARQVAFTPFARAEFDECYEEDAVCPLEWARRMLVLSHMGFGTAAMRATSNGRKQRTGFRANTTGTTPAADWSGMPAIVRAVGSRFSGVVLEQRPAVQVIEVHDGPETLHYVDPTYPHCTRGKNSKQNYRHEMTDDDHRDLSKVLRAVTGKVILSGYPCALYDVELYADWRRVERETHADGARDRVEVLWMNFPEEGTLKL